MSVRFKARWVTTPLPGFRRYAERCRTFEEGIDKVVAPALYLALGKRPQRHDLHPSGQRVHEFRECEGACEAGEKKAPRLSIRINTLRLRVPVPLRRIDGIARSRVTGIWGRSKRHRPPAPAAAR